MDAWPVLILGLIPFFYVLWNDNQNKRLYVKNDAFEAMKELLTATQADLAHVRLKEQECEKEQAVMREQIKALKSVDSDKDQTIFELRLEVAKAKTRAGDNP